MANKLVRVVRELQRAFARPDIVRMRVLSNELIEEAAIENDKKMAQLALVGYSLHKLSTKEHVVGHDKWIAVKRRVLASLEKAALHLQENRIPQFEKSLDGIVREITSIDASIGNFVQGIFEKARVKYASNAYSLGLSLSQAAELTGADKKKLLQYVGATRLSDREKVQFGIGERLKKLREIM